MTGICNYSSDFSSSINTYDIITYLNHNSKVYYLHIKDFLIRNTVQDLLFCDLFLSLYHMCLDEKIDEFEASFHSVIVVIEPTRDEVQMHVRQEIYVYIVSAYNLEQASLLWLSQCWRNNLYSAMAVFKLDGDEHTKQFDNTSVYQYMGLPKLRKFSHINEIRRRDNCQQALNTRVSSISHESRTIENPIWFGRVINQQIMLEIAILSNRILLHELQRILTTHFAQLCNDNGVRINLSTDNLDIFSTDIDKEYLIAHITFALILDITLSNLVFILNNETIWQ